MTNRNRQNQGGRQTGGERNWNQGTGNPGWQGDRDTRFSSQSQGVEETGYQGGREHSSQCVNCGHDTGVEMSGSRQGGYGQGGWNQPTQGGNFNQPSGYGPGGNFSQQGGGYGQGGSWNPQTGYNQPGSFNSQGGGYGQGGGAFNQGNSGGRTSSPSGFTGGTQHQWTGSQGLGGSSYGAGTSEGSYGRFGETSQGGTWQSQSQPQQRGWTGSTGLSPQGQWTGGGTGTMDRPRTGTGPKGYKRSNDRIREEISDIMMVRGDLDASNVTISVAEGVVTLEGTVDDRNTKRAIEDLAEGVLGVDEVNNRVRVQSSSRDKGGASSREDEDTDTGRGRTSSSGTRSGSSMGSRGNT